MSKPNPAANEISISVKVEPAMYAKIAALAKKEDLDIAKVLRRALREYLEKAA